MRASEHLALCEAKRGGATEQERALCVELKDAEARCKEMAKVIERYRTMAKRLIAVELEQKIEEARDDITSRSKYRKGPTCARTV